jgi:LmbE family N-acetylglucosaminyl deacetylase
MNVLQQRINELVERHGSIRAAARVLDVDPVYLYRLSTGEKDAPGPELLRKLKLRRVVTYERTDRTAQSKEHGNVER